MKTKLNKTQLEAVESNKGPVLIFAGAGSGKTKVLTEKIHYLIDFMDKVPNCLASSN